MATRAGPSWRSSLPVPLLSEIRQRTQEVFGVRPCLWQLKVVEAILKGDRDVVSIAGTGMGKTLTFWMPLLFRPTGVQVVVTPLNILGKQNTETLSKAGMKSIFIGADSATHENFRALEDLIYRAVIISPEQLMKPNGEFRKLFKNPAFASQIISVIFDEAHCISSWGGFRKEYRDVGHLRYILPKGVPIMITSATLPQPIFEDVKRILQLRSENLAVFRRSSDRPNVHIVVRPIQSSLGSFADLAFLIPTGWQAGDPPPPKFLVFFDNISDSIRAHAFVQTLLPKEYRDKIRWFNSDMSTTFKETEADRIASGNTWGLFTTDSFGMGMDIPDIASGKTPIHNCFKLLQISQI